jgi:hypothetical protein
VSLIEEALLEHTRLAPALAALITGTADEPMALRFYPVLPPKNPTYPLLTYRVLTEDHEEHLQGSAGLCATRFQIDAWDTDMIVTRRLSEQFRLAWQGYTGTVLDTIIKCVRLDGGDDDPKPPFSAEDVQLYGLRRDYVIWFDEAVPSF